MWDEFTGLFKEEDGFTPEKTEEHIKKYFSSFHYKPYSFGLFKRTLKCTNVYIFHFIKEIEIKEYHNKIILD